MNSPSRDIFVTGTDTGVGKTVLSALLCAALRMHYWKPIQTGVVEGTDRDAVVQYAGISAAEALPESYRFDPPVSPHLAAKLAGVRIDLASIRRPPVASALTIEGAGGVLVPIDESRLMRDLIVQLDVPVAVATRTTLGTINHTLLTVHALRAAGARIKGVVMIGDADEENRRAIEHYGAVPVIGRIPRLETIRRQALLEAFERHFDKAAFA